jgi:hypothetical protein
MPMLDSNESSVLGQSPQHQLDTESPPFVVDRRRFLVGSAITVAAAVTGGVEQQLKEAQSSASASDTVSENSIEVDGVRYAYRRFIQPGGAPPILLLHHYVDRPER